MDGKLLSKLFGTDKITFIKSECESVTELNVTVTHILINDHVIHVSGIDCDFSTNDCYVISRIKIKEPPLSEPKFVIRMEIHTNELLFNCYKMITGAVDDCYNSFVNAVNEIFATKYTNVTDYAVTLSKHGIVTFSSEKVTATSDKK